MIGANNIRHMGGHVELFFQQAVVSVVSGLVGGLITGVAAFAAIRVEMRWMRRDIDHAHERINQLTSRASRRGISP